MALSDLFPKILVEAAKALRGPLAIAKAINHPTMGSATERKPLGGNIEVIKPPSLTTRTVTPAAVPPTSAAAPSPSTVVVELDAWKEVNFPLTDRHIELIDNAGDRIPMFLEVAANALAEDITAEIFSNYRGVYGYVGTAGTTPFGSAPTVAQEAMVVLTNQRCPESMRQMVVNPEAYGNAVSLPAFASAQNYGQPGVIIEGRLPRAYGFDWHQDLMVPLHTRGATTSTSIAVDNTGGYAAGASNLHIDGLTAVPAVGDIISFAGHSQTYTVLSTSTLQAPTDADIVISPGLQVAVADDVVITVRNSHRVNLAFHPYAMAFVSRPAAGSTLPGLAPSETAATYVDEETGLALTLEIRREYAQFGFYLRCLWGSELIQPEYAVRVAG